MTAPDPGLTDLIAAALVRSSPNSIDTFDLLPYHRQEAWRVRAREVALVVEQHTNGRIAELEATIARVEKALPNIKFVAHSNIPYDMGWDRGQQMLAQYVRSAIKGDHLRAALEGES